MNFNLLFKNLLLISMTRTNKNININIYNIIIFVKEKKVNKVRPIGNNSIISISNIKNIIDKSKIWRSRNR